jgi:hypothetical protein
MQRSRMLSALASVIMAISLVGILTMFSPGADAQTEQNSSGDGAVIWKFVQAEDAINANLTRIDLALVGASQELSRTGLSGPGPKEVLLNLTGIDPFAIDCITVGLNGTVLEVEPEKYQYILGEDVGQQEHIKRIFGTMRPSGMAYIRTVEGFYAMDFAAPVFDQSGCLMGATTVLINSTEFFGGILQPYQPGSGAKIWAVQPDGLVVYDTDITQIGLNAFEAPIFKEFSDLQAIAKRIGRERSGYGTYEFFNEDHSAKVKKAIYWTTVEYQGTEMRLALSIEL